jgi:hypothetical protein
MERVFQTLRPHEPLEITRFAAGMLQERRVRTGWVSVDVSLYESEEVIGAICQPRGNGASRQICRHAAPELERDGSEQAYAL